MNRKVCVFIGMIFLFCYGNAYACSCIGGKANVKNAFKKNDVVFIGKVINKEIMTIPYTPLGLNTGVDFYKYKITFMVEKIYKGKIDTNFVEVMTGIGGGDCGYDFDIGKSYVVYAERRSKHYNGDLNINIYLYTHVCSRTTDNVESEKEKIAKYWKPRMGKDDGKIRDVFK
jgi:hypothetical protein